MADKIDVDAKIEELLALCGKAAATPPLLPTIAASTFCNAARDALPWTLRELKRARIAMAVALRCGPAWREAGEVLYKALEGGGE